MEQKYFKNYVNQWFPSLVFHALTIDELVNVFAEMSTDDPELGYEFNASAVLIKEA